MSLDIGTTVDRRYLLKREIARGGAGAVFEAEHIYTKRSVALKLLVPEQRMAPEPRARLLREALALSTARHPGVVAALDAGETEDGTPYLVPCRRPRRRQLPTPCVFRRSCRRCR